MKRIFTLLVVAVTLLTASAQSAGEYVYTDNGRFKITTGENILSNGDFSNGTADWTTDGGNALNADTFAIQTEGSLRYLTVFLKDNGPSTGSSLYRTMPVQANVSYIISYQVKGNEEGITTSVTTGDNVKNYQNVFFNEDGSQIAADGGQIAKTFTFGFDWQTVTYGFTAPADGFIVLHFYAPYVGNCFADFRIVEAQKVADDREANAIITRMQNYLNDVRFPNNRELLEEYIANLTEAVNNDDLDLYNEYAALEDEFVEEFLDANTANVTLYLKNGNFDDLSATSANQRKAGAWIIDDATPTTGKTRWAVKDAIEQGVPLTGKYLQNDIPYGSNNILNKATVHQTVTNMPAAEYMFNIKMRGYKLLNKTGSRSTEVRGLKVFINNDSTECYPLNDEKPLTYTAYTKLSETGDLKVGFYVPYGVANHIDLDVNSLRIVGWSQEQLDEYMGGKEYAEAKAVLKHSIDSARVWHADDLMLYGKSQLDSAIVASQDYYDNIAITDSLTASNSRLLKEIANYISRNATLTKFRSTIAEVEQLLTDTSFSEADKQKLQQAVDAAKTYLATLTAENHQTAGYTNDDIKAEMERLNAVVNDIKAGLLKGDEMYEFYTWAQQDGADYTSALNTLNGITTSGGTELYPETADFAGHSLNDRFAFREANMNLSLNVSHGLQVNFTSKNATTMAILNLKEGDQVQMDWAMGNASHGLMCVSANAKLKLADGTWREYTKTGKDNANVVEKDNTDGLSGSIRSTFIMNAEGTLDFYQGSSNSTLRIYYIGITNNENVTGINTVNDAGLKVNGYYDLQGRRYTTIPTQRGIYIFKGRKVVVK